MISHGTDYFVCERYSSCASNLPISFQIYISEIQIEDSQGDVLSLRNVSSSFYASSFALSLIVHPEISSTGPESKWVIYNRRKKVLRRTYLDNISAMLSQICGVYDNKVDLTSFN